MAQNQIEYHIDEILEKVVKNNASDLYLTVDLPPTIRVTGLLQPLLEFQKFSDEQIRGLVSQLLNENQLQKLFENKELDAQYELKDKARFRINVFFEKENIAATLRLIPKRIPTVDELNLPTILHEFCKLPQGLVLVTGASGAGKSTTLAAMINWINNNRNKHILTIEDPVEFHFISNKSLVHQRELYVDTLSWEAALRSVRRETVDVLLIGEIRGYETMALAIMAASMGHLVFATIHTYSAAQTIDHVIGLFPEHQQSQTRMQLSSVIEGTITQTLVRGIDQSKRFPAIEILIANNAVRSTIREGKAHFISNIINTSFDMGMLSMERSLAELVNTGKVELDEALGRTLNPDEVLRYIDSKKNKR